MDLIEVARVRKEIKQIELEKSEMGVRLEAEVKAKQEKEGTLPLDNYLWLQALEMIE